MDTEALVILLLLCSAFAAALLGLTALGLVQEWRVHKRGCQPRPGVRACTEWAGSVGIFFGMIALILLALVACRQVAWLKIVTLIFVNLVMQPLCHLFFAGGVYRFSQACRGRLTYAFRVLPRGNLPAEQYRNLLVEGALSGLLLAFIACGLSYLCIRPLL
jgi:hypothetical protein